VRKKEENDEMPLGGHFDSMCPRFHDYNHATPGNFFCKIDFSFGYSSDLNFDQSRVEANRLPSGVQSQMSTGIFPSQITGWEVTLAWKQSWSFT
jgi:hypothetical protein